jgi:site-specific DNA-cytosine methylase
MQEINTLSLFNGMGCIWLAMEEAELKVGKRYSSEIDKYATKANDAMYPDTIQLGDVRNVDVSKLEPIHFLAGGSPCQSFSFAGKRKGMSAIEKHRFIFPTEKEYQDYISDENNVYFDYKDFIKHKRNEFEAKEKSRNLETIEILTLEHYLELKSQNFEFEGQSYLFWEYIRILTDIRKYNPDVKFLLENVIMGSKWQKVLTQAIGINPIRINASLVSAQNRDRLFWTNIYTSQDGLFGDLKCMIPQPKDKGILLKDVLESEVDEKYFLSDNVVKRIEKSSFGKEFRNPDDKSTSLLANYYKQGNDGNYLKIDKKGNLKSSQDKASCFTAGGNSGGNHSDMDLIVHNLMLRSSKTGKGGTGPLSRSDGKTYCLDTGNTNAIEMVGDIFCLSGTQENATQYKNKSTPLTAAMGMGGGHTPIVSNFEIKCVAMPGRNPDNPKSRVAGLPTEQQLEPINDGKTNCLTSVQKDNLVQIGNIYDNEHNSVAGRVYTEDGKSVTLSALGGGGGGAKTGLYQINKSIRRLTPTECGRLQTIPKDKLEILLAAGISDSQLYKMFGNGWCVDVIVHILGYYNKNL